MEEKSLPKESSELKENVECYEKEFLPYIYKWGARTNYLGVACSFLLAIVLWVHFGIFPGITAIVAACALRINVVVTWISNTISYFPVLGAPGTFMTFIAGNISNLRLPVSAAAQEAGGAEPGSEKSAIFSTIGIAISVVVNLITITIGAILGASLLSKIPANVLNAVNMLIPALFGSLLAQFALNRKKLALIAVAIGYGVRLIYNTGVLDFMPAPQGTRPSYILILGSILGTMAVARILFKKHLKL